MSAMIKMVDLYSQYLNIRDDVDRAIDETIAESAFIKGTAVAKLEEELSRWLNVKHCITCGNGTDAILLSLMATGFSRGDEAIMPAFSFAAVAEAVILLGGTPVFADVSPRTFNIEPASIERLISNRTKVILPVHLFGQPCKMAELMSIANRYGIKVIEDNAQSLGSECRLSDHTVRYAGTIGHIGCTSFFPSKPLGCYGDGGAVFTDDTTLADRIRALANHGQNTKYNHLYIGLNSRLDTIQAAVLRTKLPHLDRWTASRRKAADFYTTGLADLPSIEVPVESPQGSHVYHQYTIKVPTDDRDKLKVALEKAAIASMIYYPTPLFKQPAYRDRCICDPEMQHAEKLSASVLSLPMHSELTEREQKIVIEAIRRYFNDKN